MYYYDFRNSPLRLFAGPRNGQSGLTEMFVPQRRHSKFLKIMARNDQLISSSYFYGMLYNIIPLIGNTNNSNVDELNATSKEEFYRAVRRILR